MSFWPSTCRRASRFRVITLHRVLCETFTNKRKTNTLKTLWYIRQSQMSSDTIRFIILISIHITIIDGQTRVYQSNQITQFVSVLLCMKLSILLFTLSMFVIVCMCTVLTIVFQSLVFEEIPQFFHDLIVIDIACMNIWCTPILWHKHCNKKYRLKKGWMIQYPDC